MLQPTRGPIGAHTSASGGVWKALEEGKRIGADTIQLFTANQRRWQTKPLAQSAIEKFQATQEETGLTTLMSHGSYLVNLGSPKPATLAQSRATFRQEIVRCQQLGIRFLNFHPGAALESPRQDCLARIVESLLACCDLLSNTSLHLLVETTAGQGSNVGSSFEEIAWIIEKTSPQLPIGVCIDTCHIFAAGYDIRTAQGWQDTLAAFDDLIGLEHLYAFHLNDSKHDIGSAKDRHAPLGKGYIGWESFQYLMQSEHTYHVPKYLETPDGPSLWQQEIAILKSFAS